MAAPAVTIRADGLQALQRGLRKASPALARAVTAELRSIGKTVRDDARAIAPRGETGELQRSIKHSARQGSASIFVDASIALHGVFVHQGYHPGGGTTLISARPFLQEAADARREWVIGELEHLLDRTLDRYITTTGKV